MTPLEPFRFDVEGTKILLLLRDALKTLPSLFRAFETEGVDTKALYEYYFNHLKMLRDITAEYGAPGVEKRRPREEEEDEEEEEKEREERKRRKPPGAGD